MLSTPLPKFAISRSFSPDCPSSAESIRSVTVGTSTSAIFTASASCAWLIGLSSRLSRVSNSSHIRVSTVSGNLRVTTTSGFLPFAISPPLGAPPGLLSGRPERSGLINRVSGNSCASGEARSGLSLSDGPGQDKAAGKSRLLPSAIASIAGLEGFFDDRAGRSMKAGVWFWMAAAVMLAAFGSSALAAENGTTSGLPVPRFVSLKSDKVNVRAGPTKDHDVAWIYNRAALPVEVTAEFENWRRIRDWEGAEGWVYHSLLSGKRTALVAPSKNKDELLALRYKPDAASAVTAQLQHGVLATVKKCSSGWCRLTGDGFEGWIEEGRLWGVYPGEKVE